MNIIDALYINEKLKLDTNKISIDDFFISLNIKKAS